MKPTPIQFRGTAGIIRGDHWSASSHTTKGLILLLHGGGQTRHSWRRSEGRVVTGFVIADGGWGRAVRARDEALTRFSHLIYPSMPVHQGLVRETVSGTTFAED